MKRNENKSKLVFRKYINYKQINVYIYILQVFLKLRHFVPELEEPSRLGRQMEVVLSLRYNGNCGGKKTKR